MSIDKNKISKLVTKWRDILRLYNWDMRYIVVDTLKIESEYGNLLIEPDILRATLQILKTCPIEDLENFVIHELVHVRLHPLTAYCDDFLEEFFGIRERTILRKQLKAKEENIVENLAKTLLEMNNEEK
ncbi:unnamed protein product [marine sediment metagenome]|uniref:SprT-like domain-containing protein n=1 Tax=marine sediment metagenome TaxID=412755 RepID=X1C8P1_9ZZZZ